jgi:hypothetical protein
VHVAWQTGSANLDSWLDVSAMVLLEIENAFSAFEAGFGDKGFTVVLC